MGPYYQPWLEPDPHAESSKQSRACQVISDPALGLHALQRQGQEPWWSFCDCFQRNVEEPKREMMSTATRLWLKAAVDLNLIRAWCSKGPLMPRLSYALLCPIEGGSVAAARQDYVERRSLTSSCQPVRDCVRSARTLCACAGRPHLDVSLQPALEARQQAARRCFALCSLVLVWVQFQQAVWPCDLPARCTLLACRLHHALCIQAACKL